MNLLILLTVKTSRHTTNKHMTFTNFMRVTRLVKNEQPPNVLGQYFETSYAPNNKKFQTGRLLNNKPIFSSNAESQPIVCSSFSGESKTAKGAMMHSDRFLMCYRQSD